jgi:magnesium transporter
MSLEHHLAVAFLDAHPTEAALALERMRPEVRAAALEAVPAHAAVRAMREMVPPSAAECLARVDSRTAAAVVDGLDVDAATTVLRRMPNEPRTRLLQALPARRRELIDRVLRYPEDTAGALMDPHASALPDDISISEARVRLRRTSRGLLYYLYVVDRAQRLVGVLDIAELMGARASDPLRGVMHSHVERLPAWLPANAVRTHPGWRTYHAMPVVDESDRLLGAIRYQTLRRLEHEADAAGAERPAAATVAALGELFHLGMAGLIEGISAAAVPRARLATLPDTAKTTGAGNE